MKDTAKTSGSKDNAFLPRKEDLIKEIKSMNICSTIPPRYYYYAAVRKIHSKEGSK